jgi:hypothetical protein
MTHYGLRISEYRACRACTCALAPAADEYNLNVVDCNALSLSHAGLPSQSVGVWGVPPAAGGKRTAGGKRKMVFRGLPRACWEFYGKRSFSVTTPCASPTRVDTERLAERETLLHRLGSKLNRTVLNSCGNSLSVAQITRDFCATRFFCEQSHFHEIDYFWKHQTSNSRLRHSI